MKLFSSGFSSPGGRLKDNTAFVRQIKGTLRAPTQGILRRAAEGVGGKPLEAPCTECGFMGHSGALEDFNAFIVLLPSHSPARQEGP